MAREAALFRVEGPRGIYYAVYEAEQRLLFTEANEKGARDHAAEIGLTLSRERNIRHAELMRLTGRDAAPIRRETTAAQKPQKPADSVHKPLVARLPQNDERSNTQILSTRDLGGANPFASSGPVKGSDDEVEADPSTPAEPSAFEAVNRDVINLSQAPRTGRHGNPFADRSQK